MLVQIKNWFLGLYKDLIDLASSPSNEEILAVLTDQEKINWFDQLEGQQWEEDCIISATDRFSLKLECRSRFKKDPKPWRIRYFYLILDAYRNQQKQARQKQVKYKNMQSSLSQPLLNSYM